MTYCALAPGHYLATATLAAAHTHTYFPSAPKISYRFTLLDFLQGSAFARLNTALLYWLLQSKEDMTGPPRSTSPSTFTATDGFKGCLLAGSPRGLDISEGADGADGAHGWIYGWSEKGGSDSMFM